MNMEPKTLTGPAPGAVAPVAVRCDGLVKRYGAVTALRSLSLEARAGEVHALLGENGAGKSTFIKVLGGSVPLDEGAIEVFGAPARVSSPSEARRHGIEVAYQELSLIPDLTVAQNIWLELAPPGRTRIVSHRALRRRTLELCERLDAPRIDPDAVVRHLPLAQRQVAEVLRAVASEPRIVVFDESTAALPSEQAEWVIGLARRFAGAGALVFFISHRLPELRRVADVVSVLRDGAHVLTERFDAVDDDELVEAMLGRKPQRLYPPPQRAPADDVVLATDRLSVGGRLRDVTFELRAGEILGVGGLQGQGQAELLAALFGVERARGTIEVGGRRVRIRSPRAAFHAGVGLALVPEDRRNEGLLHGKSIRENVTLPVIGELTRAGLISQQRELDATERAIAPLHVKAASPEQDAMALSGGNQQKVVIAKLLLVGARILLFHDITRGVDVGTKAEIFELARTLTAGGHSILFYSTDNQELVHMCDRVLVLRSGSVAATLSGERLTEPEIMRVALGVEERRAAPPPAAAAAEGSGR